MDKDTVHKSVLLNETLNFLQPKDGNVILDATVGCAGHAVKILNKILPRGTLIGIDKDRKVLEIADKNLSKYKGNYILEHSDYKDFDVVLKKNNINQINGALFDLGVSSFQLDTADRGFSFNKQAELDMRMDQTAEKSAYDIVNKSAEFELQHIISEYGEERYSKRIARAIVNARKQKPIKTTTELAELIYQATPGSYRKYKIDPATRTFQALRITVNDELAGLKETLKKIYNFLAIGARLVVISFNSLEDRIVKHNFKALAKDNFYEILTKKPLTASQEELISNNRARSAKLRAVIKI